MPNFLLKPNPDEDFYVHWSTIVEAPLAWGPRDVMEAEDILRVLEPDRFDRADATGTSSLSGSPRMRWGDQWIYQQQGLLGHEQLAALCARLEGVDNGDVSDLLEPIR